MKSVTREFKKTIKNEKIRKNVKAIYTEYDEEFEAIVYHIYFKENTVKSNYSCEYMDMTDALETKLHKGADAINDWLEEIAYVE